MTAFLIGAGLLLVAALALLLPPLLRKDRSKNAAISQDDVNLAIVRDQIAELDADLAARNLDPAQHERARKELEKRLLSDVSNPAPVTATKGGRITVVLISVALPLLGIGLYLLLGNPKATTLQNAPEAPMAATKNPHAVTPDQIEGMVAKLAARLETTPDDAQGWSMLAQSYAVMGRYQDAAKAYARLVKLVPDNAQLLADQADVLAMVQQGSFDGEPAKLVARALALDPNNVKALALAGSAAFDKQDYAGALTHWRRMQSQLPADSEMAQSLAASILEAQKLAGGSTPPRPQMGTPTAPQKTPPPVAQAPATGKPVISGQVDIDPALKGQVAATDTVFVFVRAAEGPRMPLAALRKQVRDLPIEFSFDDAASLSADKTLSSVPKLLVLARISKSGDAIAKPGDIEVASDVLAPGAKDIKLRLVTR